MNYILITGGLGYIGSHVSIDLGLSKRNIIIIDNLFNSSLDNLEAIEKIVGKKIIFYKIDIKKRSELDRLFTKFKISHVIHFAALKSISESINNPSQYYSNNILGLLNVLEISKKYNIKKFIFSSTASIYSELNKFPVDENGRLGYKNPYAMSKLICEDIIKNFALENPSIMLVILRYFNPIGNHTSGLLGDWSTKNKSDNIINGLYKALMTNSPFIVYGNSYKTKDGSAIRDFIHVSDLSSAHIKALKHFDTKSNCITFNVGLGYGTSVLEFVETFCKVNKCKLEIKIGVSREGDLPICYSQSNKIHNYINWKPKYNLNKMCRDAYIFYKNKIL